jgi:hypothetical protein
MRHCILTSLIGLILLCCASYVMGQGDNEHSRPSLRNLDSLVVVVSIDDNLAPYIHEERLTTIIELELRKAGIKVPEEASEAKAMLFLSMVSVPNKLSEEVVGFSVALDFKVDQVVWLERDLNIICLAATWSQQYVASWGTKKVREASEELVREMVEGFHNAYLAANAKP